MNFTEFPREWAIINKANGMWWKLLNYPLETMNAWAKYASYLLMC